MENRILALRKAKGLTQKQFGKIFGLAESTISLYETGRRQADYETLSKFADFFGVSIDCLLGRTEQEEKPTPVSESGLSEKDARLIAWFRSLPLEKQKAILISQDAPTDLID